MKKKPTKPQKENKKEKEECWKRQKVFHRILLKTHSGTMLPHSKSTARIQIETD